MQAYHRYTQPLLSSVVDLPALQSDQEELSDSDALSVDRRRSVDYALPANGYNQVTQSAPSAL